MCLPTTLAGIATRPKSNRCSSLASDKAVEVIFTPHLIPMDRGILSTCYSQPLGDLTEEKALATLREHYADEPFIRVVNHLPGTKDTSDTNFCDITARMVRGRLITISCLDNLIKGASRRRGAELQSHVRFPRNDGALVRARGRPRTAGVFATALFSSIKPPSTRLLPFRSNGLLPIHEYSSRLSTRRRSLRHQAQSREARPDASRLRSAGRGCGCLYEEPRLRRARRLGSRHYTRRERSRGGRQFR